MKIYIQKKALGKKQNVLEPIVYDVSEDVASLRELLKELTRIEVERYSKKETEVQSEWFLHSKYIENLATAGKVGFGRIYSEKKADMERAIENSLQCYEDGMIRVFHGERELDNLEESIQSCEGDVFTLIRLTFLAGRMW